MSQQSLPLTNEDMTANPFLPYAAQHLRKAQMMAFSAPENVPMAAAIQETANLCFGNIYTSTPVEERVIEQTDAMYQNEVLFHLLNALEILVDGGKLEAGAKVREMSKGLFSEEVVKAREEKLKDPGYMEEKKKELRERWLMEEEEKAKHELGKERKSTERRK